ncbi:MAG: hypothetical protein NWR96_07335 [Crocinitomicaceae bacterium]|jgi:hypothetical protein|nr:hypothetical protein [Crocinitomicaceae bacterium]MDP4761430.1 hypothetical protein [Crocinitomicaceae bacterium]
MKDGLENSFKEALNNFELPYDAQAWDALNQKLKPKRWYQYSSVKWSAALVITLGIASYFTLPTTSNRAIEKTHDKTAKKGTNSTIPVTPHQGGTSSDTHQILMDYATNPNGIDPLMSPGITTPVVVVEELIPHSIPFMSDQLTVLGLTDQVIGGIEPTPSYNAQIGIIDFKSRCQGETFQLDADKYHQRMISYAGQELLFTYNEAISLKLTDPGNVSVTANSGPYGQFEELGSFEVKPIPSIALSTDRSISYEDGLPKIIVLAESNENQVSWHSNYSLNNTNGKTNEILAFDKGNAIVEVTSVSSNGCVAKSKELIPVLSDYNLLAVNAFNPQSTNSRNSSFMPYALTIRQTPFKLIVLDPDTGGLVFDTSDADDAWDGIDRRDGKLVPGNKAYIWKVVLQNPLAGEKSEYRGTIVRM